jgi:hypothetical protein
MPGRAKALKLPLFHLPDQISHCLKAEEREARHWQGQFGGLPLCQTFLSLHRSGRISEANRADRSLRWNP